MSIAQTKVEKECGKRKKQRRLLILTQESQQQWIQFGVVSVSLIVSIASSCGSSLDHLHKILLQLLPAHLLKPCFFFATLSMSTSVCSDMKKMSLDCPQRYKTATGKIRYRKIFYGQQQTESTKTSLSIANQDQGFSFLVLSGRARRREEGRGVSTRAETSIIQEEEKPHPRKRAPRRTQWM